MTLFKQQKCPTLNYTVKHSKDTDETCLNLADRDTSSTGDAWLCVGRNQ